MNSTTERVAVDARSWHWFCSQRCGPQEDGICCAVWSSVPPRGVTLEHMFDLDSTGELGDSGENEAADPRGCVGSDSSGKSGSPDSSGSPGSSEAAELLVLVELGVLAGRVASVDERSLDAEVLMGTVELIEQARRFLDAAEGAALAELDARGSCDQHHGMKTHRWVARECGVAPGVARSRVQVGNKLRVWLPGTDQAVRSGRLPLDRAKVMASVVNERIAAEFQLLEDELVDLSAGMTFSEWCQRVRIIAALLDQDGPEPADDIGNNELCLRGGYQGTHVTGTLVGDIAVVTRSAIDQVADELFRHYSTDNEVTAGEVEIPSRATLRALAFAELCRRGLMVTATGAKPSKPKVEATLVIHADTPNVVYLDGKPLIKHSASALACDMGVWAVVMNSLGVPLDMGREIRTANDTQRRVLQTRDGGCVFPGCEHPPSNCDAHHVAHWYRDLGGTNVAHMVYLCRHHHRVIHRKGWNIHIGNDGWAWITTPSNTTLWCQQHGQQRTGPPPPTSPPSD